MWGLLTATRLLSRFKLLPETAEVREISASSARSARMNGSLTLDDRLYLWLNKISGQSALLDTLISLPMDNNLVKVGPVGASFIFAWFSGTAAQRPRRRSILLVTLASLLVIFGVTKTLGQSIFMPRPIVRSFPMLQLEGDRFVESARLAFRQPLAGGALDGYKSMRDGGIAASDLISFPSDHAALFVALSLGILFACRPAGYVALGWTLIVILLTRIIVGRHSPLDIAAGIGIGAAILFACLFATRRWARPTLDRVAQWTLKHESWSTALLFLAIFEILSLLENLKQLAATALIILRSPVRSLLAALSALLLSGCVPGPKGGLILLEGDWQAEVIATERSGITSPDGLQWIGDGLLIADEGGRAVRLWRPGKGFTTLTDRRAGIGRPEDVIRDGHGNVYFTDDEKGGIWRTSADGATVHWITARQGVGRTEGVAIHPSGRLLVGDASHHRIVTVGAAGDVREFLPASAGIGKPESFAFAPDGTLFIADNEANAIYSVTPNGRLHRPISGIEVFSPESIFQSKDALFITDSENGKLYRYTANDGLKPIIIFGGDVAKVQGIAGDTSGNLYVTIQTEMRGGLGYLIRLRRK